MIALLIFLVWALGVGFTLPSYAAADAAARGLIQVDQSAMLAGTVKAAFWYVSWAYPALERRANIELAKFPDVKYHRALEAGRVSEAMERELNRKEREA